MNNNYQFLQFQSSVTVGGAGSGVLVKLLPHKQPPSPPVSAPGNLAALGNLGAPENLGALGNLGAPGNLGRHLLGWPQLPCKHCPTMKARAGAWHYQTVLVPTAALQALSDYSAVNLAKSCHKCWLKRGGVSGSVPQILGASQDGYRRDAQGGYRGDAQGGFEARLLGVGLGDFFSANCA
ncbi:hypothetical protein T492DRAFT_1152529 [Pavlovales sp. CCMP2436]|nr:hypothetical protein T492DRAFT_1152529 [Pavlovales sp. CCMP2436]